MTNTTTHHATTFGDDPTPAGAVHGMPRLILRGEGAALLAAAAAAYTMTDLSWWFFAALFLAPDLFMLGYLADRRTGSTLYNIGHTTILPLALVAAGLATDASWLIGLGLVWLAHIGFDRMIGYGLKYPEAFRSSHLGTLGGRIR
jgi:hypothetical protein